MDRTQDSLRLARFQDRTRALGPGTRAVVWFHGCSFRCPGCIAEEMNRSDRFEVVSPSELAGRVAAIEGIEGVTLSGGDPFDQPPRALAAFAAELRARCDLGILCYTGRTLAQLRSDAFRRILAQIDILIDGLYVDALNDGRAWRGSSNQRVHFLSDRYRHLETSVPDLRDRRLEVLIGGDQRLEITGIPSSGFMPRLKAELAARGLSIRFDDRETDPPETTP